MMWIDAAYVAVLFVGLSFIGLGFALDHDWRRFGQFRQFGLEAHAYWALGFWSFFALSVNHPGSTDWLTALDGFLAVALTYQHIRLRLKARRARRIKEPTT
jgi:hypothetical protein